MDLVVRHTRFLPPWSIFVMCSVLTGFATYFVYEGTQNETETRFERASSALLESFNNRLTVYTNAITYTRNLMDLYPNISEPDFQKFVRSMNLKNEFPGLQSIGYLKRVQSASSTPPSNYSIWPVGSRREYFPVVFIERMNQVNSPPPYGYDMGTDPIRRKAMELARDSGSPVATDKLRPALEPLEARDSAFLIYIPHYKKGRKIDTAQEKQQALQGYIFAALRSSYFFGQILEEVVARYGQLNIDFYDGNKIAPESLMHAFAPNESTAPWLEKVIPLSRNEHNWTVHISAPKSYEAPVNYTFIYVVLAFGFLLTTVITLFFMLARAHNQSLERDIQVRQDTEKKLKLARLEADQANLAKSRFLANMSHEIRTPIGVILGFADLALGNKQNPVELEKCLKMIIRNGKELTRIIGEVLDLSKIEAHSLQIEHIDFSLSQLIEDVWILMELRAREKGLSLQLEKLSNLPESIRTDRTRLRQILLNIMGNALKFTEQGSVTVAVRAQQKGADHIQLDFVVTDTGVGIADEQKSNLFKAFSQADSSITRRFGGTGLGLVISRELAKALGGDLVLESSELGRGSRFHLMVIVQTTQQPLVMAPQKPTSSLPKKTLNGLHILVVDDSPDNQLLLKTYLNRFGAQVTCASDGEQCVNLALKNKYDLILLDIQMPRMDGYGALNKLKIAHYRGPIVALTAHALKEEKDRAFQLGFDDYLTKPIEISLLISTIQKFTTPQPELHPES